RDATGENEGENEGNRKRDHPDEDLRVLDLPEGLELLVAAAQGDGGAHELVRRRADREEIGQERVARYVQRERPDRLALAEDGGHDVAPQAHLLEHRAA